MHVGKVSLGDIMHRFELPSVVISCRPNHVTDTRRQLRSRVQAGVGGSPRLEQTTDPVLVTSSAKRQFIDTDLVSPA